jgi:putative N6-adenine-specific DNA methylase
MRLKPSRRTPLFNGALECRLFRFEMVAGSARKTAPESGEAGQPDDGPEPAGGPGDASAQT